MRRIFKIPRRPLKAPKQHASSCQDGSIERMGKPESFVTAVEELRDIPPELCEEYVSGQSRLDENQGQPCL